MTFDGVNTLTYDVENRLVEAQNAAWGTSTYLYDPLGHRKQKQVASGNWVTTTQFVLAGGQEIADYSGTGVGAAISLTVRGVGGLPVAAVTPAVDGATLTAVYYHHDGLGSTVAVTQGGDSGASEAYTYSDFGAPGAGSWATYRYAGYRYDNETGLYYVNARYYNPNLGRFLQTDPIGLSGGTNLYAYVGNDPINGIDPTGLCEQTIQNSGENISITAPPNGTSGLLTVYSNVNSNDTMSDVPIAGHSWISFTPDGGETTTYGTWGNTNPSGLQQNKELAASYTSSRSDELAPNQVAALFATISVYANEGSGAWGYLSPCSTFASSAWYSATSEFLDPTGGGLFSTPTGLQTSIIKANGGVAYGSSTSSSAPSPFPY